MKNLICIDFDGVIRIDDKLAPGAKEAIKSLERRYEVVVLTARNRFEVKKWLKDYGINLKCTNVKPPAARAYIDDRGYRFKSWGDVLKRF